MPKHGALGSKSLIKREILEQSRVELDPAGLWSQIALKRIIHGKSLVHGETEESPVNVSCGDS